MLMLEDIGRPFVHTQRLRDTSRCWLLVEEWDADRIIQLVILEQFAWQLQAKMVTWVQCYCSTTLESTIELVEDHVAMGFGPDDIIPTSSVSVGHPLYLSLCLFFPRCGPRMHPPHRAVCLSLPHGGREGFLLHWPHNPMGPLLMCHPLCLSFFFFLPQVLTTDADRAKGYT